MGNKDAVEKASIEKAALERASIEKASVEKVATEKTDAKKAVPEKAVTEKAAPEMASTEKGANEMATAKKNDNEKAAIDKVASQAVSVKAEASSSEDTAREDLSKAQNSAVSKDLNTAQNRNSELGTGEAEQKLDPSDNLKKSQGEKQQEQQASKQEENEKSSKDRITSLSLQKDNESKESKKELIEVDTSGQNMNEGKDSDVREAVKADRPETKDSGEVTQKISKVVGLQKKSGKSKGKKEEVNVGDVELAESQDKESGSKRHPDDAATVESQEVFQIGKQEIEKEKQEKEKKKRKKEKKEKREKREKYENNNTSPQNITKCDFASENDNVKMESKRMEFDDSIQRKNSVKQKKQLRQQSEIPDSEEVPDIETFNDEKAAESEQGENKDLLSQVDDLDLDDEQEFRRSRRASSYEETLANMDPELLAELGLSPSAGGGTEAKEPSPSAESLDLSQLPMETAAERMSRILLASLGRDLGHARDLDHPTLTL